MTDIPELPDSEIKERPDGEVPWPKSKDELLAYIDQMLQWPHDARSPGEGYGRCVYAMSNAALATFNFVAQQLGVTGFQASAAEMQFLADSRGMKHGFMVLNGDKLLYPQCDLLGDATEWIQKTLPRLRDVAREKLAEDGKHAHPDVRRHWEKIAALPAPEDDNGE